MNVRLETNILNATFTITFKMFVFFNIFAEAILIVVILRGLLKVFFINPSCACCDIYGPLVHMYYALRSSIILLHEKLSFTGV